MLIIPWLPESPRYLLQEARRKNKAMYYKLAYNALCRFRNSKLQAGRGLFLMDYLLEDELRTRRNLWIRLTELFSRGRNYRALRASIICLFLQQFCGVNTFAYFSGEILRKAGASNTHAIIGGMGFGVINFVLAIPAFWMIDRRRFGRRNLLLFSFPFLALFQLVTGLAFLLPKNRRTAVVMAGMCRFS